MERPFKDVSKKESTVYNIGANSNDYSESDSSDSENTAFRTEKIHVHSPYKMAKNRGGGLPRTTKGNLKHREPVATRTRQIMGYVTVKNIELETGYPQEDWPIFVLKELSDNAYDWLNAYYPPAKNKKKPGRIIKRFVKLEYEHGLLWMVTTTGTGLYI